MIQERACKSRTWCQVTPNAMIGGKKGGGRGKESDSNFYPQHLHGDLPLSCMMMVGGSQQYARELVQNVGIV